MCSTLKCYCDFVTESNTAVSARKYCTKRIVTVPPSLQSFQKELGSHQKGVDAANTSGEHLVQEILDDPAITQQDLQELNETWEGICQSSIKKQERLDEAYEVGGESDYQWLILYS